MDKANILIVDDEKEIRDLLKIFLSNEGFNVFESEDGTDVPDLIKTYNIQLVILDIMLPDIDGIRICSKIREKYDIPIIMLSAKGESNDKIVGILTGADDYVSKPFNPLEVVVRVKAQLKRYLKNMDTSKASEIVIDDLVISLDTHSVKLNGKELSLTNKEFEILKLLSRNRGKVFSSRKIYQCIWGEEFLESDSTVMTHIKNLREKLGDNTKDPKYIKTVWGVGYKIDK